MLIVIDEFLVKFLHTFINKVFCFILVFLYGFTWKSFDLWWSCWFLMRLFRKLSSCILVPSLIRLFALSLICSLFISFIIRFELFSLFGIWLSLWIIFFELFPFSSIIFFEQGILNRLQVSVFELLLFSPGLSNLLFLCDIAAESALCISKQSSIGVGWMDSIFHSSFFMFSLVKILKQMSNSRVIIFSSVTVIAKAFLYLLSLSIKFWGLKIFLDLVFIL